MVYYTIIIVRPLYYAMKVSVILSFGAIGNVAASTLNYEIVNPSL